MSTKLSLDDQLVASAVLLGQHCSENEAVMVALEQYVQRLQQRTIFEAFGKIGYDKNYVHRRQRNVK